MTTEGNGTFGPGGGQQPGSTPAGDTPSGSTPPASAPPASTPGQPLPGWPPAPPTPGYSYGPAYPPPRRPTNNLAIAALILGILSLLSCPLVGGVAVYLGNRARAEINRTGEEGAGFAQAGIIIGWFAVGLTILLVFVVLAYVAFMFLVVSDTAIAATR